MKKRLVCVLLALCVMGTAFARETTLTRRNVTAQALLDLLDSDEVETKYIDDDGDLFIKCNGVQGWCLVLEDQTLLDFLAIWSSDTSRSLSQEEGAEICNKWNRTYYMASAYFSTSGRFCLVYYLPYEGGVTATNFNTVTEMFFEYGDTFWDFLIDEGAL